MDRSEKKYCRFVSVSTLLGYHDSFEIEDGGTIFVGNKEYTVNYIDSHHFTVGFRCYHIQEFYEVIVQQNNYSVTPGKGLKTKEYGSNWGSYKKVVFSYITVPELDNKEFMFTDLHLIRESLPLGVYAYDIRHDDEGKGIACSIENRVAVNHLGTIIVKEPLLGRDEVIYLENDICYGTERRRMQA